MTCDHCRQLAARSPAVLAHRLAKIAEAPEVGIFPCERCGGTEECVRHDPSPRDHSRAIGFMIKAGTLAFVLCGLAYVFGWRVP